MKAITQTSYGSPNILSLNNVEKPQPKKNEVLVKVVAASITRADTMMRTGKPYIGRLYTGLCGPKHSITGTGFAGVIENKGDLVKQFNIGDKVFGESIFSTGSHAEYLCIPETMVISRMPENLSFQQAATLCDGALTSLNFINDIAKLSSKQHILINGASGSLGSTGVQIAKALGAKVTAVCSTPNVDWVKQLGADNVIDYKKHDFTNSSEQFDVIYDAVGKTSYAKCQHLLKENGVFISPALNFKLLLDMLLLTKFKSKKAIFSATGMRSLQDLRQLLQVIIKMIQQQQLTPIIDKEYSLEEVVEAHTYIDLGHKKGNVVFNLTY